LFDVQVSNNAIKTLYHERMSIYRQLLKNATVTKQFVRQYTLVKNNQTTNPTIKLLVQSLNE